MSNHDVSDELLNQIETIRVQYKQRLVADRRKLSSILNGLTTETVEQCVENLHRILHSMSGSAGTFGFEDVGTESRRIDEILKKISTEQTSENKNTLVQLIKDEVTSFCELLSSTEILEEHNTTQSLRARSSKSPAQIDTPEHDEDIEVWLIEEDKTLAEQFSKQLVNFNFKIRTIELGQALEEAGIKGWPDATILDMDGYDFSELVDTNNAFYVKHESPGGLIMLSENDDFEQRMKAAKARALSFMKKPVAFPELIGHLEVVLNRKKVEPPRVMLIDDDKELCSLLKLELESEGMRVNILSDIKNIIPELAEFRPELLLLDMEMPDYSGIDIALLVRQHVQFESLPIVYLSAEQDIDKQAEALLFNADDFLVKPILYQQLISSIRSRIQRARVLNQLISKDGLTGLLKHAAIKEQAELEVKRAQREASPVSIVMLDIDHFKRVNDTYGHATGDTVIASVATLLRHRLRSTDIIGRYGGEEFMVILPNTPETAAFKVIDTIRKVFSEMEFVADENVFNCTFSGGCVCSEDFNSNVNASELTEEADKALYLSKNNGRNRVSKRVQNV
ncbi:diguanylate cyclase [Idiomarina aminovorans]|uniref:diguanylate cyclase n=1 Tax=Idiomarina aminovorans TaxID=2914829 RepID=UPI002004FDD2|nr:diguanylate cyclase [Idiomarina sp. ATCH4]MCK7460162.1 diguanylate cyclase [Idiomarina sp. ATCH4]